MPPAARAAAARFGRAALSSSRSVAEKQRRAILDASGDLGAALGVVAWAGSAFCYLGIAHIGRDSPAGYWGYWFLGFLVWTSALCEWNYRLFAEKADRRRGAPRWSVSEVRTPRPFPMPSPSTDDEQGERIEGSAA